MSRLFQTTDNLGCLRSTKQKKKDEEQEEEEEEEEEIFFLKSVSDGCEGDGGGTTMKMRMFRWWFSWAGRQHFQEEKIWFGSYTL